MNGLRFGLLAFRVAAFYRQFVALLQCGQCRRRVVRPLLRLPPDFAPAALSDDCAFGDELHAAALQPCRRYLFDADPAEGFDHTAGNQVVDRLLLGRQARRCYLRNEQGMMIRYLVVVDGASVDFRTGNGGRFLPEQRMPLQGRKQRADFSGNVFGNVTRAGAGISDVFLLVERLRDAEGLVG